MRDAFDPKQVHYWSDLPGSQRRRRPAITYSSSINEGDSEQNWINVHNGGRVGSGRKLVSVVEITYAARGHVSRGHVCYVLSV